MISLEEILEKQKRDSSKYKVAVCVTSYNQSDVIENALEGILNQKTTFPFLIVVGDDCSTDGSMELLKSYQENYPDRIRLVLQPENVGLFQNRKAIFKCCDAPYIAFCDGDDYWIDENCLQKNMIFWKNIRTILDIRQHALTEAEMRSLLYRIWKKGIVFLILRKKMH